MLIINTNPCENKLSDYSSGFSDPFRKRTEKRSNQTRRPFALFKHSQHISKTESTSIHVPNFHLPENGGSVAISTSDKIFTYDRRRTKPIDSPLSKGKCRRLPVKNTFIITRRGTPIRKWATGVCVTGKKAKPKQKRPRGGERSTRAIAETVQRFLCEAGGLFATAFEGHRTSIAFDSRAPNSKPYVLHIKMRVFMLKNKKKNINPYKRSTTAPLKNGNRNVVGRIRITKNRHKNTKRS